VKQIGQMLKAEDPHKRIAAALVLGELKVKDGAVVNALAQMAADPLDAYANAALGALGEIGSSRALPALLAALGRTGETRRLAARALAALGPEALPEIKAHLEDAPMEIRAAVAEALPAMGGGKASFGLTLEGLRGQPWDAVNKVALSVRHEVKSASPAERRAMKAQLDKFIAHKKTAADEPALRGALKILGYLELPESVDLLLGHLGPALSPAVRVEAVTALRFALSRAVPAKPLTRLTALLEDPDALVRRAARDSLMTLKFTPAHAPQLGALAVHPDNEIATWALTLLGGMGGAVAEKTLLPVALGPDRHRAQAAARAVAALEGGERLLATGLCKATSEQAAQVLCEALMPVSRKLSKKDLGRLLEAGQAALSDKVAVARRKLEPLRELDPQGWATVVREKAKSSLKKDPARAATLLGMLCRSPLAIPDDRYTLARMELEKSPRDPHPRARARDTALLELEKLADEGFALVKALEKDKALDDETLYYLGFHFGESLELREVGEALLEVLVKRSGRTRLGKAAKNKLAFVRKAKEA
jgi:hypothetical protein